MKAFRYVANGAPLQSVELPDPIPDPGWVLVDVEVAGLCHSDVHVIDGIMEPPVGRPSPSATRSRAPYPPSARAWRAMR